MKIAPVRLGSLARDSLGTGARGGPGGSPGASPPLSLRPICAVPVLLERRVAGLARALGSSCPGLGAARL